MDEDRLKHSISVARKMVAIGKEYHLSEEELKELFMSMGTEFFDNHIILKSLSKFIYHFIFMLSKNSVPIDRLVLQGWSNNRPTCKSIWVIKQRERTQKYSLAGNYLTSPNPNLISSFKSFSVIEWRRPQHGHT